MLWGWHMPVLGCAWAPLCIYIYRITLGGQQKARGYEQGWLPILLNQQTTCKCCWPTGTRPHIAAHTVQRTDTYILSLQQIQSQDRNIARISKYCLLCIARRAFE